MKNCIENLADEMIAQIKKDVYEELSDTSRQVLIRELLNAYNRFQDDNRDCADYIYGLDNQDDLAACVKGGMTAKDIAYLYNESQVNTTQYFFINPLYKAISNEESLVEYIMTWIYAIVINVLAYPEVKEYTLIYNRYVYDTIVGNGMLYT